MEEYIEQKSASKGMDSQSKGGVNMQSEEGPRRAPSNRTMKSTRTSNQDLYPTQKIIE